MADDPDHGQGEAHTRRAAASAAADGVPWQGEIGLAKALGEFDQAVETADADLFSLLEHSVERDATDSLTLAAKSVTDGRKGPGRPKGSTNRRNVDTFDWLEAHGHRSPEYTLSLIQTIDPRQLAVMMRRHKHFATALAAITKAAAELLPYKLAKKSPDVVAPPPVARPAIVFNTFNGVDHRPGVALGVGRIIDNDVDKPA